MATPSRSLIAAGGGRALQEPPWQSFKPSTIHPCTLGQGREGAQELGGSIPSPVTGPPPALPIPQSSATMESARSSLSLASFSRSLCSSLSPGWSICAERSPKILCISV